MASDLFVNLDISAVVSGEKAAWDRFAEKYAGLILGMAQRVLRMKTGSCNPEDARDIAQEVFVRLVRNNFRLLRLYDPAKSSLSTWLTVVTRSTTLDYLRASARHSHTEPLSEDLAAKPDEPFQGRMDLPADFLSKRQRQIVRLLYFDGLDVGDVADMLKIRAQTVRSLKHKALDKLRLHYGLA